MGRDRCAMLADGLGGSSSHPKRTVLSLTLLNSTTAAIERARADIDRPGATTSWPARSSLTPTGAFSEEHNSTRREKGPPVVTAVRSPFGPHTSRKPRRRLTKSGPLARWNSGSRSKSENSCIVAAVPPAKIYTARRNEMTSPSCTNSPSCIGARNQASQPNGAPPLGASNSSKKTTGTALGPAPKAAANLSAALLNALLNATYRRGGSTGLAACACGQGGISEDPTQSARVGCLGEVHGYGCRGQHGVRPGSARRRTTFRFRAARIRQATGGVADSGRATYCSMGFTHRAQLGALGAGKGKKLAKFVYTRDGRGWFSIFGADDCERLTDLVVNARRRMGAVMAFRPRASDAMSRALHLAALASSAAVPPMT